MKKNQILKQSIMVIGLLLLFFTVKAQNCLEITLTSLMNQVPKPTGSSANNFSMCTLGNNADGTQFVIDAGVGAEQLLNQIEQINKDATTAMQQQNSGANPDQMMQQAMNQANNNSNSSSYQNMSQQQMMQQGMKQHNGYDPKKMDKPDNLKLVMQANQANMQITILINEMTQKLTPIRQSLQDNLSKADMVFPSAATGCPTSGPTGLPVCACVIGHVQENYNAHIKAYNDYATAAGAIDIKYSSLVNQQLAIIDQCINKLHNGKDLIAANWKQMLVSAQTTAVGTIGGTFLGLSSDIITSSGKAYCRLSNIKKTPPENFGCAN